MFRFTVGIAAADSNLDSRYGMRSAEKTLNDNSLGGRDMAATGEYAAKQEELDASRMDNDEDTAAAKFGKNPDLTASGKAAKSTGTVFDWTERRPLNRISTGFETEAQLGDFVASSKLDLHVDHDSQRGRNLARNRRKREPTCIDDDDENSSGATATDQLVDFFRFMWRKPRSVDSRASQQCRR